MRRRLEQGLSVYLARPLYVYGVGWSAAPTDTDGAAEFPAAPDTPPSAIHTATRLLPGAVRPWVRSSQRPLGQGFAAHASPSGAAEVSRQREQLSEGASGTDAQGPAARRGFQVGCRPPPRSPDEARPARRSTPPPDRAGRRFPVRAAQWHAKGDGRRRRAGGGRGALPVRWAGRGDAAAAAAASDSSAARRRYGR